MNRRVLFAASLAATLACGETQAAAPPCAGDVEIGDAPIARVEHNDVLILNDGRALHLEGIRLPHAAQDRAPQALEDQAYEALNALTKNQDVEARAVWPKEDRYDRVRSQIFTKGGTWVQSELLRRGLARVDLAPDRGECFRELYDAESAARAAQAGIWSSPAYAIRTPDTVKADVGTFQIVLGKVLSTDLRDGRAYLNFGTDWKTDFTVTISPDDMKTFRRMGVDPLGYQDKLVRVRGIVQWLNGPEIEIGNPKQIELLQ
ncbi:MAG: thermonuclease family protein [Rhizomicrobium sp.]|jgi:endonuclease YncB( thermonuclease family)